MSSRPPIPSPLATEKDRLFLDDGSRVAVIGGGPAGTFFTYFLFEMAERIGMELAVDIYEPRDFTKIGPQGCNMCGGIVSESLVQLLATEGINLPSSVVQRGIDSYVLHMDVGTVRIEPTRREKRIAAVYRGGGPRGSVDSRWHSFDAHLLELAKGRGAQVRDERVEGIDRNGGKPRITTKKGTSDGYDLLVGAVGVNTGALKIFEEMGAGYRAPGTTKTYICARAGGDERRAGSARSLRLACLAAARRAAFRSFGSPAVVGALPSRKSGAVLAHARAAAAVARADRVRGAAGSGRDALRGSSPEAPAAARAPLAGHRRQRGHSRCRALVDG